MANLYLAGPGAEVEVVIERARALEALGHVFTQPWWERVIEGRQRGWMSDADVPFDYMRENAIMNRRGLDRADIVIALTRLRGGMSPGTAGEVAYAVGMYYDERIERNRIKIFIVGDPRGFVWACDPAVTVVPTMADVLPHLPRVPGFL
jgi:hypothetical protein